MTKIVNIPSQIVVQTSAQWAADVTVYSEKRLLITSDVYYGATDQRKIKIADGVKTWANLSYIPISGYDDATSSIQTQLNSKQASLGYTAEDVANKQDSLAADGTATKYPTVDAINNLALYWRVIPGNPTRSSNYILTITDASNANLYNLKFGRTTILKWVDTGVTKMAMVHSATYATNTVTITVIGDIISATATMSSFKFAIEKCKSQTLAVAGTIAVANNITGKLWVDCAMKYFGADGHHGTAGTTNATTYTISKNAEDGSATTLVSPISIASGATSGDGFTATDGSTLAKDDYLVANCTGVSTTAPQGAYIKIFMVPLYIQYLN